MDSLIHADIFFFITSISVILLTFLFIISFFYILQILINIRKISKILREGTENAEEQIANITDSLSENVFLKPFFKKKKKKKVEKK